MTQLCSYGTMHYDMQQYQVARMPGSDNEGIARRMRGVGGVPGQGVGREEVGEEDGEMEEEEEEEEEEE